MEDQKTTFDRLGSWINNSIMLKLMIITFLML